MINDRRQTLKSAPVGRKKTKKQSSTHFVLAAETNLILDLENNLLSSSKNLDI